MSNVEKLYRLSKSTRKNENKNNVDTKRKTYFKMDEEK